MDKRLKLIVIGLVILAAISLLVAFQLQTTLSKVKAAAEEEIRSLQRENENLTLSFSKLNQQYKALEDDFNSKRQKLEGIEQEFKLLSEKYDAVTKDRDSLVNKVQMLVEEKRKIKEDFDKQAKRVEELEKKKEEEKKEGTGFAAAYTISPEQESQWAEIVREKAALKFELESIQAQLKEMTYKVDELTREKNALEMELKGLVQAKDDLERKASYNEKLADSLAQDLVREKNDKEIIISQLDKLKQDNIQMRGRIKDLEETKTTLYKKLDNLEQERNILQEKLKNADSLLQERVNEIVKIKNEFDALKERQGSGKVIEGSRTVELSPIVVQGKQEPTPVTLTLTGRVLSINKDYNFVVIDLGTNAGVKVNDEFVVYRDNKFIAHLKVVQTREEISAADIKDQAAQEQIREGDIVKKM